MNYEVVISMTARQEEAEAYLYYESKSDGLGEDFLEEVEKSLQKVLENPTFFSYCDSSHTLRGLALSRFPFVIIYEIIGNKIVVTNIHHTKKNH